MQANNINLLNYFVGGQTFNESDITNQVDEFFKQLDTNADGEVFLYFNHG